MLLHEFDPNPIAIINPSDTHGTVKDCPKVAVSCFERSTFERMVERLGGEEITRLKKANWDTPVYRTAYKGREIALFEAYVGAAGCVGDLEELFFAGVEKLVLFGTCGVLDKSVRDCGIIIPTSALRDEGASFHYAPPSDEIEV
ncbi:MAG: phosphorylase, partial [Oscillospiraceae bacterium]|nr:phosphorylase [Oscillospiraceae bacterium]